MGSRPRRPLRNHSAARQALNLAHGVLKGGISVFITYLSYNKYLKCTLTSSRCTIGLCGPGRADLISSGLPRLAVLTCGRKAPVFLNSGRRWADTEPLSGLANPASCRRWAGRVPGRWVPVDGSLGILPAGLWARAHWSPPDTPLSWGAGRLQPRNEGGAKTLIWEAVPGVVPTPAGGPEPGLLASLPPWASVPWMARDPALPGGRVGAEPW